MSKTENSHYLITLLACILAVTIFTVSIFSASAVATATPDEAVLVTSTEKVQGDLTLPNGDVLQGESQNGVLTFDLAKAFDVVVKTDDATTKVKIAKGTVVDAIQKAGISLTENQVVLSSLDQPVYSNMEIVIEKGVKINLKDADNAQQIIVPQGTVENALKYLNCKLSDDDILNVSKDSQISENMSLEIQRVTFSEETSTQKVAYDTKEETTSDLSAGETKVKTEGKDGEKEVVEKVKFINGKEDSRETVKETVTTEPQTEVVLKGKETSSTSASTASLKVSSGNTLTDENGNSVSYTRVVTGSGTAYTAPAGSSTATGTPVYLGGVAVNPNIIPYGTKLYITSSDGSFVYGYATAIDTGGALMDGSAVVDLFYPTYDQCVNFGRRNVNVYVLG